MGWGFDEMDAATYIAHLFAYGFLLLVVLGMPILAVQALLDWLGPSPWRFVVYPVYVILYLGIFGIGWLAHNAARRRALGSEG